MYTPSVFESKKTNLFGRKQTWNGRCISKDGVKYAPKNIQGLQSMPLPKTAGDLQQFICSVNWIRNSIPDFNRKVAKLQQKLAPAIEKVGTKRSRLVRVKISWDEDERQSFQDMKGSIMEAVTLAHRDEDKTLHLI